MKKIGPFMIISLLLTPGAIHAASHSGGTGKSTGATVGATTAALKAAYRAGLPARQVDKINHVLQNRTNLDNFKLLPKRQAMLFIAAYKKDEPLLKRLVDELADLFWEKRGVWNALAELFFDEPPTDMSVRRLKEGLFPGT